MQRKPALLGHDLARDRLSSDEKNNAQNPAGWAKLLALGGIQ